MTGRSEKLRFGASYCPYAKSLDIDERFFERDVAKMKELNFNTMRCFVSWDRIERREGEYDFSKLDLLFDLTSKYGIDMILNIGGVFDCYGGIYAPRWLLYDYHCQEVIDPEKPSRSGPRRRICPDDPVFSEKARRFTIDAVNRYRNRPNLCGWNVWNEAFYWNFCVCPLTMAKYRDYLKNLYNHDLDELNRVWGTEFPIDYRDWDEIDASLGQDIPKGGYRSRMDFLAFNRDRVSDWVGSVNDLVHKLDNARHPTTCNVVSVAVMNPGSHNNPDVWGQNGKLDIAGYSFYSLYFPPKHASAALSTLRSCSNDPERGFWILETAAGHHVNPSIYPGDSADREARLNANCMALLHGAKTILLWKLGGRVSDYQADLFNLQAWDGSDTERSKAAAKFAGFLHDHESLFLHASYNADTAILYDRLGRLYAETENTLDEWYASSVGAYERMLSLHIPADYISEEQVLAGKLDRYKALLIPYTRMLTPGVAEKIRSFAARGGLVVADRSFNLRRTDTTIFESAPGDGLSDVFGASINDWLLSAEDETVKTAVGPIGKKLSLHAELHISPDAEVLGTFKNGSVGAVRNTFGEGAGVFWGIDVFVDDSPALQKILRTELACVGIKSDYEADDSGSVEIGALTAAGGKKIHFVLNYTNEVQRFHLKIHSASERLHELWSGTDFINGTEIALSPWGVMILSEE